MNEPVRWVTKAEAAEELEVSLSTLDRMIRKGEVEVSREGRRVYVRMEGPAYPSDGELLRRAIAREEELERTVRKLERQASESKLRASERERDEARESVSAGWQAYAELEEEHRRGQAAHGRTRRLAFRLGLVVVVLLVVVGLLTWRLVA